MLPRSARLAAWGTAVLASGVEIQLAVKAVTGDDEPHEVNAEIEVGAVLGLPEKCGLLELLTTLGTRVVLVAARGQNGVIGSGGGIPWKIPADFAHFKRVTVGHPLVLGRTTFEGIGKPLPDRQSIVVTSDPDWSWDGVLVARSVPEAIDLGPSLDDELVNVGGGAHVYRAAMELATDQILTEVHLSPAGDTHYPEFDETDWRETRREGHTDHDPAYEIRWLERR